ncbi:MAG: hypothetical protein R8K49_07550 [Mariprofundaceae bacterium]
MTQDLMTKLECYRCVNLISPHGQGRRRTLRDIQYLLPDDWQLLKVDMKMIENQAEAVLSSLCVQAKMNNIPDFTCLFEALNKKANRVLIIIHNFDILDDSSVYLALNELHQYEYLMLLITTVHEQHGELIRYAQPCLIADISTEQMRREMERRFPKLPAAVLEEKLADLMRQPLPYHCLDELNEF